MLGRWPPAKGCTGGTTVPRVPTPSLPPGKRRVRATQLLKKFIKMSSSTERQSQKWHGDGGGTGRGLGTRQSRRKQQRSESAVHTRTRQLQRGPDDKREGKIKISPRTRRQSGTLAPAASCGPPHWAGSPCQLRGHPTGGGGGQGWKMGGGPAKKPEPPWASATRRPRWEMGGLADQSPSVGEGARAQLGNSPSCAGLGGPCAGLGARPRVRGAEHGACREGWGRTRSRPLRILFPTGPGILGAKAKGAIKEGRVGGGAGNVTTAGRGTRLVPGGGPLCFLVPRL